MYVIGFFIGALKIRKPKNLIKMSLCKRFGDQKVRLTYLTSYNFVSFRPFYSQIIKYHLRKSKNASCN